MEVSLFIGCINDVFYPRVGTAAVKVLRELGVRVHFPEDQSCCGQAHFNSGYWDEAARLARHFCRVFGAGLPVVTPAGSCAAMVNEVYGQLLGEGRRTLPVPRVWEFSEFLVARMGVDRWEGYFPARAVLHVSCHTLRWVPQGARAAKTLLESVKGLSMEPFADWDRCCGFGGTFAVKAPELSVALADEKLDRMMAAGAQLVISSDTSCLMHLMGRARRRGLPLRFAHVAEVLAEARGLLAPQAEGAERAPKAAALPGSQGTRPLRTRKEAAS
ncbi:MAG TPA: (Fe-S)-binding protein [Limnochordales bacterium]